MKPAAFGVAILLALGSTGTAWASPPSFDEAAQFALKGMLPRPMSLSGGNQGYTFADQTMMPGTIRAVFKGGVVNQVVVDGAAPMNTFTTPYVFLVTTFFTSKWCAWKDEDSILNSVVKSYRGKLANPRDPRSFRVGTCSLTVALSETTGDPVLTLQQVVGPPRPPPVQVPPQK